MNYTELSTPKSQFLQLESHISLTSCSFLFFGLCPWNHGFLSCKWASTRFFIAACLSLEYVLCSACGKNARGDSGTGTFVTCCLLRVYFEQLSFSACSRVGLLVILSLQTFDCYPEEIPGFFVVVVVYIFPFHAILFPPNNYCRHKLFNDCDIRAPIWLLLILLHSKLFFLTSICMSQLC